MELAEKLTLEFLILVMVMEVKVYNAGSSGDTVVVTVHWQLSQLLFPYSDVVELKLGTNQ